MVCIELKYYNKHTVFISMQVLLIKDKLLINYLSFFAFAKLIVFLPSDIGLDYFFRYFIDCLKLIVLSIATGV